MITYYRFGNPINTQAVVAEFIPSADSPAGSVKTTQYTDLDKQSAASINEAGVMKAFVPTTRTIRKQNVPFMERITSLS